MEVGTKPRHPKVEELGGRVVPQVMGTHRTRSRENRFTFVFCYFLCDIS